MLALVGGVVGKKSIALQHRKRICVAVDTDVALIMKHPSTPI